MSDDMVRRSQHSQLNSTDVLVIRMHHSEDLAFVHLQALDGRSAEVTFSAFNEIDALTDDLDTIGRVPPGIDEAPIALATVNLVASGQVKFKLRDAALAPANQFNRVTVMHVVSGRVSASIAAPTPYDDYLRYPASTPI